MPCAMRAVLLFADKRKLLLLAEGFSGPAFHPACLGTAAVLRRFRGIAQARAEVEPCFIGKGKLPHLNTGSSCSNLLRPSTREENSVLVRSLSSGPTNEANPGAAPSFLSCLVKGFGDGGA